jgi:homoserine dehydrogenase
MTQKGQPHLLPFLKFCPAVIISRMPQRSYRSTANSWYTKSNADHKTISQELNLMTNRITLCLVGFGNAAQAFCHLLLQKQHHLFEVYAVKIDVVAITTRSKGALFDYMGIDLSSALEEVADHGIFSSDNPQLSVLTTLDSIQQSHAHVLVELSTLSIEDGQPAIQHIEEALCQGMHVITANKGPIAWDFKRLKELADQYGKLLLHETVVMDGTPIFNLVKETLPGCSVIAFKGILNSTTNFILEEMETGKAYEDAVKEAQRRGFAEADPSLDVEGWDAAAKTSALLNVLMEGNVTPPEILREGIMKISPEDLKTAKRKSCKIKLLCEGWLENGQPRGRVYPSLVEKSDLFSTIDATSSILSVTTDLMGEICMVERHPEIEQTAYGIYSDLLTLIRKTSKPACAPKT